MIRLKKLVLELTEKLTLVHNNHINDDFYQRLSKYFSNEDFAYMVAMISQINFWNRISISANRDVDKNYK